MQDPGGARRPRRRLDASSIRSQRHPIMVSQQPATLNMRVPRGSHGPQRQPAPRGRRLPRALSAAPACGNSRLVIARAGGSPNEGAAMRAVADMREHDRRLRLLRHRRSPSSPTRAARDADAPDPPRPICATSPRARRAGAGRPISPTDRATCTIRQFRLRAAAQSGRADRQSGRSARSAHDDAGRCGAPRGRDRQIRQNGEIDRCRQRPPERDASAGHQGELTEVVT